MIEEHNRDRIRQVVFATLGLLFAAAVLHAAWRGVAPAVAWLDKPAFGQSLMLTLALLVVGRLLRPGHGAHPGGPHRRGEAAR